MISFDRVSKTYNGTVKAVDNLSLEIKDGEIFGLLGPNGAGKTTSLKMLTGILAPSSGKITLGGFDIAQDPIEVKKRYAFVPDDPSVFLRLTGLEYLRFIADIYQVPKADRTSLVSRLAEDFGLEAALKDKIASYSHGMRQKIVLMGALIHSPDVWILDEPMTGLDPRSAFTLKIKMREHADAGKTVLFSTHVLEVAEKVCDRIGIIDQGKLLFCGTIEQMREQFSDDRSLETMFLELTEASEGIPS